MNIYIYIYIAFIDTITYNLHFNQIIQLHFNQIFYNLNYKKIVAFNFQFFYQCKIKKIYKYKLKQFLFTCIDIKIENLLNLLSYFIRSINLCFIFT